MGRTITRWDKHPVCLAVTTANGGDVDTDLCLSADGTVQGDGGGTGITAELPDRLYVTCASPVTLSYIWNNDAAASVAAAPTNGQYKEQGVRFLRADETQVIELAGGARYFHHRVNSGTPLLTIEFGRSAGSGS